MMDALLEPLEAGRSPVAQKNKAKGVAKQDAATAVRRNLARRDYKQALKDAKTGWRQQPTPELRTLLEEAYLERTKQLLQFGFVAEAQSTLKDLLALGITEAKVRQEAMAVAAPLGLEHLLVGQQGRPETPLDSSTLVALVDSAVLYPGGGLQRYPEIAREAAALRQVLDQLAAGQMAAALAGVSHIPRHSPLADWRLFVRGLAAYYRQDDEEMSACWSRLDPARVPAKIARALQSLADWIRRRAPTLESLGVGSAALCQVEKVAFGEPIVGRLCELHRQTMERDWEEVLRTLQTLPRCLGPQKTPLALMAAQAVMASGRRHLPLRFMERLTGSLPGPPNDPRWNRAWALFHELEKEGNLASAARHWIEYIHDIEQGALPAEDQRLAKALVWHRAACGYLRYLKVEEADPEEAWEVGPARSGRRADPPERARPLDHDEAIARRAVAALENSIKLAPELPAPYRDLSQAYFEWGLPDRAVEVYQRLLHRHPDSLGDLVAITGLLLDEDRPIEACTYARKAYHLKPLDGELAEQLWRCLVESARCHGMRGEWDASRAMLAEAASLAVSPEEAELLPAFHAVLEFKAGDVAQARSLVWEAVRKASHPACGFLGVAIQAKRWKVPRFWAEQIESHWEVELCKRFDSKAASAMARLLSRIEDWERPLSEAGTYLQQVVDYLARGTKCRWQYRDLLTVCEMLGRRLHRLRQEQDLSEQESELPSQGLLEEQAARIEDVLKKLLSRAIRLFPEEPRFFAFLGEMLLSDGPILCDQPYARYVFRQLRKLTENASDPNYRNWYRRAEAMLELLGPGPVSSRPKKHFRVDNRKEILEMVARALRLQLMGDEESEEDDEKGEAEASPSARPQPKRRSAR